MSKDSAVARRQAPLRAHYAHDRSAAITVKRVRTVKTPATDALHGTVIPVGYPDVRWDYGTDAKVGGLDDLPNSGHILVAALAACMDNTLRMLADLLGVGIEHLEVEVRGDVDVRGCLAMEETVRPGFRQLACTVHLEPDPLADPKRVAILTAQAERLCVTLDTLRHGVPVDVSFDLGRSVRPEPTRAAHPAAS